ncbi:hypothetical protein BJX65DRAFT_68313 [Aspergillus insuetus]
MRAMRTLECWDGILPDGQVNAAAMTRFNHYALGAVTSWLHSSFAGISTEDGRKTVRAAPKPGGHWRRRKQLVKVNMVSSSVRGDFRGINSSLILHSFQAPMAISVFRTILHLNWVPATINYPISSRQRPGHRIWCRRARFLV